MILPTKEQLVYTLASTMRVNWNLVLALLVLALSTEFSKQDKPEDCAPGKEFLSTFINSEGACVACPRHLDNCDEQGPDKEACEKSCGAKQVSSSVLSSTTSAISSDLPSQLKKVSSTLPITAVASSTVLQSGKPKDHDDKEPRLWIIPLVLLVAVFVLGSTIVVFKVRKCRKNTQGNVDDGFGPFPLRPPVQVRPSSLRIGGIQETEAKQDSTIHLDETNC